MTKLLPLLTLNLLPFYLLLTRSYPSFILPLSGCLLLPTSQNSPLRQIGFLLFKGHLDSRSPETPRQSLLSPRHTGVPRLDSRYLPSVSLFLKSVPFLKDSRSRQISSFSIHHSRGSHLSTSVPDSFVDSPGSQTRDSPPPRPSGPAPSDPRHWSHPLLGPPRPTPHHRWDPGGPGSARGVHRRHRTDAARTGPPRPAPFRSPAAPPPALPPLAAPSARCISSPAELSPPRTDPPQTLQHRAIVLRIVSGAAITPWVRLRGRSA